MAKHNMGAYNTGYFGGGSNIYLNLIMCKDNIVIPLILQIYALHWYHKHILHLVMDRMEYIIHQHLYWTSIRKSVWKEVKKCGTCQYRKRSNIKYDKLPNKQTEKIPWNKKFIFLIVTYIISIK